MSETPYRTNQSRVITSRVGPPQPRAGYEKSLFPGIEVGLEGWERSHSQGAGTGNESRKNIVYAPREVNQDFQNQGIEKYIRETYSEKAADVELDLTTVTDCYPGTNRLSHIQYKLEAIRGGVKTVLYEASIEVADQKTNPRVTPNASPRSPVEPFLRPRGGGGGAKGGKGGGGSGNPRWANPAVWGALIGLINQYMTKTLNEVTDADAYNAAMEEFGREEKDIHQLLMTSPGDSVHIHFWFQYMPTPPQVFGLFPHLWQYDGLSYNTNRDSEAHVWYKPLLGAQRRPYHIILPPQAGARKPESRDALKMILEYLNPPSKFVKVYETLNRCSMKEMLGVLSALKRGRLFELIASRFEDSALALRVDRFRLKLAIKAVQHQDTFNAFVNYMADGGAAFKGLFKDDQEAIAAFFGVKVVSTWHCGARNCPTHSRGEHGCQVGPWSCRRRQPPCPGHSSPDHQCNSNGSVWTCGARNCPTHSEAEHCCQVGVWFCTRRQPPCPGHSRRDHHCQEVMR